MISAIVFKLSVNIMTYGCTKKLTLKFNLTVTGNINTYIIPRHSTLYANAFTITKEWNSSSWLEENILVIVPNFVFKLHIAISQFFPRTYFKTVLTFQRHVWGFDGYNSSPQKFIFFLQTSCTLQHCRKLKILIWCV